MDIKDFLKSIPNSVSGDGQTFAMKLKIILRDIVTYINNNVEEKLDQLGDGAAAAVTGLKLTEQHTTDSNGMPQNNILVEYDNTNVENFLHCQIWVKTGEEDSVYAQYGTASGLKYIIEGVKAGETYTVKAVSVNKQGGTSSFVDSPIASITIKGSVLIPDPPKQFILTWDEIGPLWEWLHEDNGYVDFYELRLDANAGSYDDKLLDRTRVMRSRTNPEVRSGTAYLFARNIFGTYSQPATHDFSKPVAGKPSAPVITKTMNGINISMDKLPTGYTGYKLIINNESFETVNSEFVYLQFSGTVKVKYCFVDPIGDGEYSDDTTVTIKTVLELVELPTIDRSKIDESIKRALEIADAQPDVNSSFSNAIVTNSEDILSLAQRVTTTEGAIQENTTAITQNAESITSVANRVSTVEGEIKTNTTAITQNAESITSVVTELGKDPSECSYSAITSLVDAIELRVVKDGIVTAINLSPEQITIDGKFLHITGTTLIDNNVIVGGNIAANSIASSHIQSNAISTDKLAAGAVTADKIEAGAIHVGGENGNVTIENGAINGDMIQAGSIIGQHISAGAISSANIAAGAINTEHLEAGAVTADKACFETLRSIAAKIGEFSTGDAGTDRIVISDSVIKVIDSNDIARVEMGLIEE